MKLSRTFIFLNVRTKIYWLFNSLFNFQFCENHDMFSYFIVFCDLFSILSKQWHVFILDCILWSCVSLCLVWLLIVCLFNLKHFFSVLFWFNSPVIFFQIAHRIVLLLKLGMGLQIILFQNLILLIHLHFLTKFNVFANSFKNSRHVKFSSLLSSHVSVNCIFATCRMGQDQYNHCINMSAFLLFWFL